MVKWKLEFVFDRICIAFTPVCYSALHCSLVAATTVLLNTLATQFICTTSHLSGWAHECVPINEEIRIYAAP